MPEKDLRKIDRLVAETVMGHTVAAEYGEYWIERQDHMTVIDGKAVPVRDELPHYSSDISAAWQVVEKMRRSGWDYFSLVQGHEGAWDCMFMQWLGPDDAISQEIADTASLAICLAALRAVGVEVPEDA